MTWWRRSKESPPAELDSEGFSLWLLAGRPPFEWFARQPRMAQEHLADLGVQHVTELAGLLGAAIRNPAGFADGAAAEAGDVDAEAGLVMQAMRDFAARVRDPGPPTAPPGPTSLGGTGGRKGSDVRSARTESVRHALGGILGAT